MKSKHSCAISIDSDAHFAVMSIENQYPSRRQSVYKQLLERLRLAGVQSPSSFVVNELNHIHIYLCFDKEFKKERFYPLLETWLEHIDLCSEVKVLNQDEPIELPLQRNFAWVDTELRRTIKRSDMSTQAAIAKFLSDLNKGLLNLDSFVDSISKNECPSNEQYLSGQLGHKKLDTKIDLPEQPGEKALVEIEPVQTVSIQEDHPQVSTEQQLEETCIEDDEGLGETKESIEFILLDETEEDYIQLQLPINLSPEASIAIASVNEERAPP